MSLGTKADRIGQFDMKTLIRDITKFKGSRTKFPPFKRAVENTILLENPRRVIFNGEHGYDKIKFDDTFMTDAQYRDLGLEPPPKQEPKGVDATSAEAKIPSRVMQAKYNDLAILMFKVIQITCDTLVLNKLETKNIPRGDGIIAWKTLCSIYSTSTAASQTAIFDDLIHLKQRGVYKDVTEYVHRFMQLTQLLHDSGQVLTDDIQKHILLSGLSPHFNNIKNYLSMRMKDHDLNAVIEGIIEYAESNPDTSNDQLDEAIEQGLNADYKTTRPQGPDRDRVRRCFNCGLTNHQEGNCRRPCRLCVWDGKDGKDHTRRTCPRKQELVAAQKKAGISASQSYSAPPRKQFGGSAASEKGSLKIDPSAEPAVEWGLMSGPIKIATPLTPVTPENPRGPLVESPYSDPCDIPVLRPQNYDENRRSRKRPLFSKAGSNFDKANILAQRKKRLLQRKKST